MRARVVKPGFNFEYMMWLFTRFSALAMYLLAFIGVVAALILGARVQMDLPTLLRWTFFPNPNHIRNSLVPSDAIAWINGFWKVMEILLVFLGVSHGFNGLRVVVEDYLGSSALKPVVRGLIFLLWVFMLIVAVFVILNS
jgi:succinate dehydrogenase / fumarate reductase, membrane anchor subunit